MALSKEQLSKPVRRYQTVKIENLGDVRIQTLTMSEVRLWQESAAGQQQAAESLAAASVVDDSGDRIFDTAKALADALEWKSVVDIANAAMQLNRLKDEPKNTADTAKN